MSTRRVTIEAWGPAILEELLIQAARTLSGPAPKHEFALNFRVSASKDGSLLISTQIFGDDEIAIAVEPPS